MSTPDYYQKAEDHHSILIVIKLIGVHLSTKSFHRLYDKICNRLRCIKVTNCTPTRSLWIRYKTHYSPSNNEWGDFQTFRRVLGLISIGKYDTESEVEQLCEKHKELEQIYATTLYDSRCLLLGGPSHPEAGAISPIVPKQQDSSLTPVQTNGYQDKSLSSHCLIYPSTNVEEIIGGEKLEKDLTDFISSIFWVLESKRMDNSFEKLEKVPLLMAPFEKKDLVGIDTDTRQFKKRCLARMRKQIGDLSLQAGLPLEALSMYHIAAEQLKATNDWLWLASTLEGQCAASAFFHYPPEIQSPPKLHRNFTTPVGHCTPKPLTKTKSSGNRLNLALLNGLDPQYDIKNLGKSLLTTSEIIEKYREAINYYSNYSNASIIRMECSSKAARILVLQEKYLLATEFIMNIIKADYEQSLEDRVEQCKALAQHYADLGFHRKSAFFKRAAALNYVSSQTKPDYQKCYTMLLEALDGYKLTLDPKAFPQDHVHGWPSLQIRILLSLINSARSMENEALAIRHLTFLLQTLSPYMSATEKLEYCLQLEALTSAKGEGGPVTLALDNGYIIPPVNLTRIPTVRAFRPQNLSPHLRPIKLTKRLPTSEGGYNSPFIFSPLNNHHKYGSAMRSSDASAGKLDFKWVQGDICEVTLQVYNPMPFELKVTNVGLMADGLAFESFPASLSLPAESGPYPFSLGGTPLKSGELQLLGYQTHVLGVKSNCLLRDLPSLKRPKGFTLEVVPSLPILQITTSLPKAASFPTLSNTSHAVTSAQASLYAGQATTAVVTLNNDSSIPIERVDLTLQSRMDKELEARFISWDQEELIAQLPILPQNSATLTLRLFGAGGFIYPLSSGGDQQDLYPTSNPISRTIISRASPLPSAPIHKLPESLQAKTHEAILQIQYSGGPGLLADYGRHCAVALVLDVMPSVAITKWDVLPGDIPSHCYLVLDLLNGTQHEMELHYAENKRILMEAGDTCRVPVPVERCPLVGSTDPMISCQNHLCELVKLSWSLALPGGLSVEGQASVGEIPWTASMLDSILLSPVDWDLQVDGFPFSLGQDYIFPPGYLVCLSITLHNLSEKTLESLHLGIQTFQDHQNGHHNYRLETKRAVVGADKILIHHIPPQGSHCHECRLMFFHSGQYKISIQCSSSHGVWRYSPFVELTIGGNEREEDLPTTPIFAAAPCT